MRRIALVLLFVGCISASGIALSFAANIARQQSSDTSASSTATRQPTHANESRESQPCSSIDGEEAFFPCSEGDEHSRFGHSPSKRFRGRRAAVQAGAQYCRSICDWRFGEYKEKHTSAEWHGIYSSALN